MTTTEHPTKPEFGKRHKGYRRMIDGVGETTTKGAVADLKIYAYSTGAGFIVVDGVNHSVGTDLEAADALLGLWMGLRRRAGEAPEAYK